MTTCIIVVVIFIALRFLISSGISSSCLENQGQYANYNFTIIEEILKTKQKTSQFLKQTIYITGEYKKRIVRFSFYTSNRNNGNSEISMTPNIQWKVLNFFSFSQSIPTDHTAYYRSDNRVRYIPNADSGTKKDFLGAQELTKNYIIDILEELTRACEILEKQNINDTS
jgi:hypothetical protein